MTSSYTAAVTSSAPLAARYDATDGCVKRSPSPGVAWWVTVTTVELVDVAFVSPFVD